LGVSRHEFVFKEVLGACLEDVDQVGTGVECQCSHLGVYVLLLLVEHGKTHQNHAQNFIVAVRAGVREFIHVELEYFFIDDVA